MYVRLTYIVSLPGEMDKARKIFKEEIAPVVKQQKGNIDIMLLESVDFPNESISFTSWQSQADADAYEATGLYQELVNKARHAFARQPVLKNYKV